MWICVNDGFLSAVQDRYNKDYLIVRARRKNHLEDNFPERTKEIFTKKDSDYPWRLSLSKKEFAVFVAYKALSIDYDNFKKSVKEKELHNFYMDIWWEGLFMQDVETELSEYYKKAYCQRYTGSACQT